MSRRPIVSVVIIFFNAERFIEEAIESVYAQRFDDWELWLVDDGSTDRSTEVALRHAAMKPGKVRYLEHARHENRGMSASRNLGIDHSTGTYIALLDADDVWLPHKLAEQVAILDAHPEAGMVYGASEYWRSWSGAAEDRDTVPWLGIVPRTVVQPPTLLIQALDATARTPCPSDLMVRRKLVEDLGGFEEHFRGTYQLYEDQAFLAKVYLTAPVFVSSSCWDRYRQHPDSCVSVVKQTGHKYSAGLYYLTWLERYLRQRHISDEALWKSLRRKRRHYRLPRLYRALNSTRRSMRQMARLPQALGRALPARVSRWLRGR
jgi:glycosyltransferase involved in cell wall biosynthesis